MMVEVQSHGFEFEKWVRDEVFSCYSGNYGQEWDIPAEHNVNEDVPYDLRGLPVSIKTAQYGSPIGLGDVLRQRSIDIPFIMIVGFWKQRTSAEKWFEDIGVSKFTAKTWENLWGGITIESLQEIDTQIKNLDFGYLEARKLAWEWKKKIIVSSESKIVVNPKIDSKRQRRIQCSLPFRVFWNNVGREADEVDYPKLFGHKFPNPIISSSRTFNRD